MPVHMQPVISSAVAAIGHDGGTSVLFVRFVSGKTYEYLGVPAQVFSALENAESKGRFVNTEIKTRYPFRHQLN